MTESRKKYETLQKEQKLDFKEYKNGWKQCCIKKTKLTQPKFMVNSKKWLEKTEVLWNVRHEEV